MNRKQERCRKDILIVTVIFQLRDLHKHFSLILMHDVIEHISDKVQFLSGMRSYLSSNGMIFIAFPAWQMPFGGHQQIAHGRIISHLPFIHLLPHTFYKWMLKMGGEQEDTIKELLNIKETKCSIEQFRRILEQTGYQIVDQQLYLINPHYEVKFGLSPRKLNKVLSSVPYIRNFFSTSCFYLLRKVDDRGQ